MVTLQCRGCGGIVTIEFDPLDDRTLRGRIIVIRPPFGRREIVLVDDDPGFLQTAYVFASALGRDRGCGFLHDRSLDWPGLVTYYTVFVIDLASRRVHIVGSTPHPDEQFMGQVGRTISAAGDGVLIGHRVLICDRDWKWTPSVRQLLSASGIRVV